MQATTPTILPAERSVPVRIMHPAIPSAIGRFAAESDIIFIIDATERNRGFIIAITTIAAIIKRYNELSIKKVQSS